MTKKYGVNVHSLIPFDDKFRLDEAAFRKHLRRLGEAGVSVYIGAAGAAEGNTLTRDERDRVLAIAVEELKGKVIVRAAGVEPRDTREMVEFLKSAEALKVDAAQIIRWTWVTACCQTARKSRTSSFPRSKRPRYR